MRPLHPLGVTVAAALAMLGLPFWWAMAVLLVWLLFAAGEVTIWILALRADRLRHEVRTLIERELASIPDAPRAAIVYPRSWHPFIDQAPVSTAAHGGPSCPR